QFRLSLRLVLLVGPRREARGGTMSAVRDNINRTQALLSVTIFMFIFSFPFKPFGAFKRDLEVLPDIVISFRVFFETNLGLSTPDVVGLVVGTLSMGLVAAFLIWRMKKKRRTQLMLHQAEAQDGIAGEKQNGRSTATQTVVTVL